MKVALKALCILAVASLTVVPLAASAADYPTKQLRWVVPFPPAGASDILSRLIAQKLSEAWGQPIVVENEGAASGVVGAELVAKAPADGYTIMLGTNSTHAVNPALFRNMKVDVVKDFTPVRLLATNTLLLAVHPSLPVKTYAELVAYAKANPGKLNYGSAGNGTSPHIAMEWLKQIEKIDIVHIPYRGSAASVNAQIANEVQVQLINLPNAMPAVREGKMRILAQTGPTRLAEVADTPTFVELGVKDYVIEAWLGIFFPAGVPGEIAQKASDDIGKILKTPDVVARFKNLGLDPADIALASFAARQKADVALWATMVKDTGARPD